MRQKQTKLNGGGWSTSHPGRFTPGKDQGSIVWEVRWALGPVRTRAETSPTPGFDHRTVHKNTKSFQNLQSPAIRNNNIVEEQTCKTLTAVSLSSPQPSSQVAGTSHPPTLLFSGDHRFFSWVKRSGREASDSPQSNARIENQLELQLCASCKHS